MGKIQPEQITDSELQELREEFAQQPRIVDASVKDGVLSIRLESVTVSGSSVELVAPLRGYPPLADASDDELADFQKTPISIRWSNIGRGVLIPAPEIAAVFGLAGQTARMAGSKGGKVVSEAKREQLKAASKQPRGKKSLDEFECTCGGCPDNPKTYCPRGRAILRRREKFVAA